MFSELRAYSWLWFTREPQNQLAFFSFPHLGAYAGPTLVRPNPSGCTLILQTCVISKFLTVDDPSDIIVSPVSSSQLGTDYTTPYEELVPIMPAPHNINPFSSEACQIITV